MKGFNLFCNIFLYLWNVVVLILILLPLGCLSVILFIPTFGLSFDLMGKVGGFIFNKWIFYSCKYCGKIQQSKEYACKDCGKTPTFDDFCSDVD